MSNSGWDVSELVMTGFAGKTLASGTRAMMKRERAPLYILFAQNYEDPRQLIELTDEIQALTREAGSELPALISVDQEGGRVQRFRKGFTLLPPAMKVGERDSPELALELTRLQARELYAAGLQLNFSPVCDVNTNPLNPVIGDRAYGDSAERVARIAPEIVKGHREEGVEACLKHFPGHGDTHLDSHESLPTVHTPLDLLRTREWLPFREAMKAGARFVMSAHILLPHLDPVNPGTLSPTFLKRSLRDELGYTGVITSDDMEMGAITKNYGADEAPIRALEAGCDLLCYRSEDAAVSAMESIRKALASGRLDEGRISASVERIRSVRRTLTLASTTLSRDERLKRIGSEAAARFVTEHFA
jgi:beta-N-acetylhexosaminidase